MVENSSSPKFQRDRHSTRSGRMPLDSQTNGMKLSQRRKLNGILCLFLLHAYIYFTGSRVATRFQVTVQPGKEKAPLCEDNEQWCLHLFCFRPKEGSRKLLSNSVIFEFETWRKDKPSMHPLWTIFQDVSCIGNEEKVDSWFPFIFAEATEESELKSESISTFSSFFEPSLSSEAARDEILLPHQFQEENALIEGETSTRNASFAFPQNDVERNSRQYETQKDGFRAEDLPANAQREKPKELCVEVEKKSNEKKSLHEGDAIGMVEAEVIEDNSCMGKKNGQRKDPTAGKSSASLHEGTNETVFDSMDSEVQGPSSNHRNTVQEHELLRLPRSSDGADLLDAGDFFRNKLDNKDTVAGDKDADLSKTSDNSKRRSEEVGFLSKARQGGGEHEVSMRYQSADSVLAHVENPEKLSRSRPDLSKSSASEGEENQQESENINRRMMQRSFRENLGDLAGLYRNQFNYGPSREYLRAPRTQWDFSPVPNLRPLRPPHSSSNTQIFYLS